MGNLCSDSRTESQTPWTATQRAILQGAAHSVVAAVNYAKDSPFRADPEDMAPPLVNKDGERLVSPAQQLAASVSGGATATGEIRNVQMQLDDTVIPMHLHHEAWEDAVCEKMKDLTDYVDNYSVWPRVQAFRAAKLAIAAQAKVARLIAPALVSHFAQATKQPIGYSQLTLNTVTPILAAHYTRFRRDAGIRARSCFEDLDRSSKNYITLDDLQAVFLPKLLREPDVIVKGRRLSISVHDDYDAASEREEARALLTQMAADAQAQGSDEAGAAVKRFAASMDFKDNDDDDVLITDDDDSDAGVGSSGESRETDAGAPRVSSSDGAASAADFSASKDNSDALKDSSQDGPTRAVESDVVKTVATVAALAVAVTAAVVSTVGEGEENKDESAATPAAAPAAPIPVEA